MLDGFWRSKVNRQFLPSVLQGPFDGSSQWNARPEADDRAELRECEAKLTTKQIQRLISGGLAWLTPTLILLPRIQPISLSSRSVSVCLQP